MNFEIPVRPSEWVEHGIQQAVQKWILAKPSGPHPTLLMHTTARGQTAAELFARGWRVTVFEPDHFRFRALFKKLPFSDSVTPERSSSSCRVSSGEAGALPECSKLSLVCQSDPAVAEPVDVAALALRRDGMAEYARDLMQQFALSIQANGWLVVGTDHPNDHWVGEQLRKLVRPAKGMKRMQVGDDFAEHGATIYVVPGDRLRVRQRDFRCEIAFRDRGQLIPFQTRPGVFSHRKLDLGARRLIDSMEIAPNCKLLEIGCGAGPVSIAATLRGEGIEVHAIDSSARAVECAKWSAAKNEVSDRLHVSLNSCDVIKEQEFDAVVANPPYFANMNIAALFLKTARQSLRDGGMATFVGKQPEWYAQQMPIGFERVTVAAVGGGYCIATGVRGNQQSEWDR